MQQHVIGALQMLIMMMMTMRYHRK